MIHVIAPQETRPIDFEIEIGANDIVDIDTPSREPEPQDQPQLPSESVGQPAKQLARIPVAKRWTYVPVESNVGDNPPSNGEEGSMT